MGGLRRSNGELPVLKHLCGSTFSPAWLPSRSAYLLQPHEDVAEQSRGLH